MTKHELERLAERYQAKADEAYYTYQETGLTRYNTARRNNEDLADAMRMAAAARDDHAALIQLRGTVADLAAMAKSEVTEAMSDESEIFQIYVRRCKRCGGILTSESGIINGYGSCCLKKEEAERRRREAEKDQLSFFEGEGRFI